MTLTRGHPTDAVDGQPIPRAERPPRLVLIVDDDSRLRSLLSRNLTSRGLRVCEAETLAAAQQAALAEPPDLLLLDIALPDGSGWDLLRALRQDGRLPPTIILSAARVGRNRLEEFRPLAYLPKPFPLEALLRLVSQAIASPHTTEHPTHALAD